VGIVAGDCCALGVDGIQTHGTVLVSNHCVLVGSKLPAPNVRNHGVCSHIHHGGGVQLLLQCSEVGGVSMWFYLVMVFLFSLALGIWSGGEIHHKANCIKEKGCGKRQVPHKTRLESNRRI
jgi:hypothetical protein